MPLGLDPEASAQAAFDSNLVERLAFIQKANQLEPVFPYRVQPINLTAFGLFNVLTPDDPKYDEQK